MQPIISGIKIKLDASRIRGIKVLREGEEKMITTSTEKAAAILANRIAILTKPISAEDINDAFGTEHDFADSTVEQVAKEMTTLIQSIVEALDDVNESDRFPEPVVKAELG